MARSSGATPLNTKEFRAMDTTAPPRIRLYWSAESTPSAMPV